MVRIDNILLATALIALAACNNEPDPKFKQSIDEREAAKAGDPYAPLSQTPKLYSYTDAEPGKRQSVATEAATSLQGSYQAMLGQLDGDAKVERTAPLFKICRPAFDAANGLPPRNDLSGSAASKAGAAAYGKLAACRKATIAAEQNGQNAETAKLLRRFASTGMVLTGIATIAHGAQDKGLQIWRAGDAFVAKDMPGFELNLKTISGQ